MGASTSACASPCASASAASETIVMSGSGSPPVSPSASGAASGAVASLDPLPHPAPIAASVITKGIRSARRIVGVYREGMDRRLRGAKLLVVGGGVSGLSAAVLAAERGADVELLDEASA